MHGVRALLRMRPDFVVVRLDLRNAYNEIDRAVLLERMEDLTTDDVEKFKEAVDLLMEELPEDKGVFRIAVWQIAIIMICTHRVIKLRVVAFSFKRKESSMFKEVHSNIILDTKIIWKRIGYDTDMLLSSYLPSASRLHLLLSRLW